MNSFKQLGAKCNSVVVHAHAQYMHMYSTALYMCYLLTTIVFTHSYNVIFMMLMLTNAWVIVMDYTCTCSPYKIQIQDMHACCIIYMYICILSYKLHVRDHSNHLMRQAMLQDI